jgi:hypothetical protein
MLQASGKKELYTFAEHTIENVNDFFRKLDEALFSECSNY